MKPVLQERIRGRPLRAAALAALLIGAVGLVYWGAVALTARRPPSTATAAPVPVIVGSVTSRDLPIWLTALGTVHPLNMVTVRVRLDGELRKVTFQESQLVKAGDLLAEIDPRPFEVQLTLAQGQMTKDEALLKNARLDLERYKTLFAQDSISQQQLDTQESLVRQYEGVVKTDQGQIDSAKLQLTYCRVTAPIGGLVGLRLIDPGNMVHAADTNGLVVITQMQPIAVMFALPQDDLLEVLAQRAKGKMPVAVYSRDGVRHLADGELGFVDNQVDPTTGQIKLKALFTNADGVLWPGEFVSTRLLLRTEHNTTVVPSRAVLSGQDGPYVYVVTADNTVEARSVKTGPTADGVTALRSGVTIGETIVLDGQSRLGPGARVSTKAAADASGLGGRS